MNRDEQALDAQIEQMMKQLEIEKAPATLTARLHRIPEEESRKPVPGKKGWSWLRGPGFRQWALVPALAAVPLVVIVVMMLQPKQPSHEEIVQARHDLAVAFAYIDKVGLLTGNEIQTVIGTELRHTVKENLSEHIPFTEQSQKEKST